MIYLDNAATSLPKPPMVERAVRRALQYAGGAGRGGHAAARYAADTLFNCREEAAALFHISSPERVILTGNATHALNMAIWGLVPPFGHVVTSGFEHNAVTRPLASLQAQGVRVTHLSTPLFEPEVAVHQFEQTLLREPVSLVVCVHVSNVFGYVLPVERLAALCAQRGIPMVVDASQSAGIEEIDAEKYPGVFWCMPGHKSLYGPQGTGLLLCPKDGPELKPLIEGGTGGNSAEPFMPEFYPDRLEAGTHNMHGAAGLLEGLRFVRARGLDNIRAHELNLLDRAVSQLRKLRHVRMYTSPGFYCQTGVLSFTIDGLDCETAAQRLSEKGIAVRSGLHCAPLAHKTADTFPQGTVRISPGVFSTSGDIDRFVAAVKSLK